MVDQPACGAVQVPESHTHLCRVLAEHRAALAPHRCDCGHTWPMSEDEMPEGVWTEPFDPLTDLVLMPPESDTLQADDRERLDEMARQLWERYGLRLRVVHGQ